ncbi:hypothetical protein [Cupriavidus sp. UYPR2.512]|uniref:hypothetical protein n=1 Tax=Cupriavidus sp. UYPR2.512 TaxID=1080187 RepID=UPI000376B5B5|nr:hypothetical protein [Cupriavidus sp. UYPR2.512]UIF89967.1 hypothetical protein KAF44_39995 [Cupriavidus necator]
MKDGYPKTGAGRLLALAAELKASASLVLDEPTWLSTGLALLRVAEESGVEARLNARSDTYPNTFSLLMRGEACGLHERIRTLTPAPVFVHYVLDNHTWRVELDLRLLSRLQGQYRPVDRRQDGNLWPKQDAKGVAVASTTDGCGVAIAI